MSFLNGVYFKSVRNWQDAKKRIRKGLSLIEAAMVLALSAIVVAGVIAYYQAASDNQKTEATISMLTNLISVVHSTYASQPNYLGIDGQVLAKTGGLPSSMIGYNTKGEFEGLFTPGGSMLKVGLGRVGDDHALSYFNVSFHVSKNMCPIMARLDLGSSLAGFYIGSTRDESHRYLKPLDVKQSETICEGAEGAGGDDQVELYYVFH